MNLTGLKVVNFSYWVKVDRECVVEENNFKDLRREVLERDHYACMYCGDKKGPFEADHVMPRSRGGLDLISNLVCACRTCNRSKGNKTPEEWGWKIGSI